MSCAAARRRVLQGAVPGKVGLPRVVAPYGWSLSCWFDAHPWGLSWGEAVPGVSCCLPLSAWPTWGLCHDFSGGVASHIGRSAPLVLGGSSGWYGALPLLVTGRSGHSMRVSCWVVRGRPDGAASRVREGVIPVSARGGLGPWGVHQTSQEGAAEGTEVLVHKGCVRCLGFRLSADGGQLSAQRQRRDLMGRKNGAQVSRSGGLCRLLVS